jgi:hypothetical protein
LRSLLFLTSLALTGIFPTLSAAAPVSQTPQLHFNGRSASLKEALVTAGDIEGIPGGPLNVTVSKVNDATGLYQDPDPRLPCGAKAPKLNARNAVEEQFAMPEVNGYEVAANLPESQIRRLFNSYEGDVRPGCSYQSKTNTGATQTTTVIKKIPMPTLATRAIGLVVVITNGGQTLGAYEMAVSDGARVAVTFLIAGQPVRTSFVVTLANVLEKRLAGRLAA